MIEPLSSERHQNIRVRTGYSASFGDGVNQTILMPAEFVEAQREYPIIFRKLDDGSFTAVALLGLGTDENLFLEGDQWNARYVPASRRHGPFSIEQVDDKPVACIDLASSRISDDGAALFLPQGGHSPYLQDSLKVLQVLASGIEMSAAFFKALSENDLIEDVSIRISLSESEHVALGDAYLIDEAKLTNLAPDVLADFNARGFLALCYAVLASMGNVKHLAALAQRRRSASGF